MGRTGWSSRRLHLRHEGHLTEAVCNYVVVRGGRKEDSGLEDLGTCACARTR